MKFYWPTTAKVGDTVFVFENDAPTIEAAEKLLYTTRTRYVGAYKVSGHENDTGSLILDLLPKGGA